MPPTPVNAYDVWHRTLAKKEAAGSPLAHPWYASVFRELAQIPGGRLLEVGCGRGEFAVWLSTQRPDLEITAMDFSPAAIDIARQRVAQNGASVQFVEGDAEAIPFPDDAFDIVISCECMEHVPHPPQMAREMARVLKQGGQFALTTPSQLNGVLLAWLHARLTGRPYNSGAGVQPRENFYFFWNVKRYLQDAGLEVGRMESSGYQWLLLPRVDPAKLRTDQFQSNWARKLAFPFGLHFSFFGTKMRGESRET